MAILLCFFIFILFFIYIEPCKEAAVSSLIFFTKSIFPSLFPFCVITSVLIETNFSECLGKYAAKLSPKAINIPTKAFGIIILGSFAGFPTGAKLTAQMYSKGEISKNQAEIICSMSNIPSFIFMTSIIGKSILNNYLYGLIMWIIILFSSVFVNVFYKKEKIYIATVVKKKRDNIPRLFCKSISNTIYLMLSVCSFIVFFSCINALINSFSFLSYKIKLLIAPIFELASGSKNFALSFFTNHSCLSIAIICALCSWSGMSVHMQVYNILSEYNLSGKKYFISKILSTFTCFLVTYIIFFILKK